MNRNRICNIMIVLPILVVLCCSIFCGCNINENSAKQSKSELSVMLYDPIVNHRGSVSFDALVGLSGVNQKRFVGTYQVWYEYGCVKDESSSIPTEPFTMKRLGSVSSSFQKTVDVPLEDVWYKAFVKDGQGNIISTEKMVIPVDLQWVESQQ